MEAIDENHRKTRLSQAQEGEMKQRGIESEMGFLYDIFNPILARRKRATRPLTGHTPSGVRTYHKPPKYCVRYMGGPIVAEFGKDKHKAKARRNWLNGTLDGGPYHVSMVRQ